MGTEGPYCGMPNSHQNEQAQSACTNSTCSKQATYHCVHGKNMYACTHKRWYKDSRKGLEGWASNRCCGCLWGGEWPQGTRSQKTQALSMVFEVLQWECLYVAYLLFKEKQCYVKWWTRDVLKQSTCLFLLTQNKEGWNMHQWGNASSVSRAAISLLSTHCSCTRGGNSLPGAPTVSWAQWWALHKHPFSVLHQNLMGSTLSGARNEEVSPNLFLTKPGLKPRCVWRHITRCDG